MGFHHRELSSGDTVPHSFGQEVSFRKRLWEEKKAATSGASACASTSCLGLVRLVLGIVFLSYSAEHNAAALLVEECAECAMWLNGQGTLLLVMGIAGFIVALVEAAGGVISDWEGRPLSIHSDGRVLAAASAQLHAEALQALRVQHQIEAPQPA